MQILKAKNKFFKFLAGYITLISFWSFSLFIFEESLQTAMFSSWAAQDTKAWHVVHKSSVLMDKLTKTMRLINNSGHILNPLGYWAYDAYADASDLYIEALRLKIFANQPELLDQQILEFDFYPKETLISMDGFHLKNGNITVITDTMPKGSVIHVIGKVDVINGRVVIDMGYSDQEVIKASF